MLLLPLLLFSGGLFVPVHQSTVTVTGSSKVEGTDRIVSVMSGGIEVGRLITPNNLTFSGGQSSAFSLRVQLPYPVAGPLRAAFTFDEYAAPAWTVSVSGQTSYGYPAVPVVSPQRLAVNVSLSFDVPASGFTYFLLSGHGACEAVANLTGDVDGSSVPVYDWHPFPLVPPSFYSSGESIPYVAVWLAAGTHTFIVPSCASTSLFIPYTDSGFVAVSAFQLRGAPGRGFA